MFKPFLNAFSRSGHKRVEQGAQWAMALLPAITGVIVASIITTLDAFNIYALSSLIIGIASSGATIRGSWDEIPADPPNIAIPTVWGSPLKKIEGAGLKLFLNFFPFYYHFIQVLTEKRNRDFNFEIRCRLEADLLVLHHAEDDSGETDNRSPYERLQALIATHAMSEPRSGGEVAVTAGITWEPDFDSEERIYQFVQAGRDEGVIDILNEVIGEDFRQLGRKLAWVHMTFATDIIGMILVHALTGAPVPKLRTAEGDPNTIARDENGKPQTTGETCHPLRATEAECKHYLDTVLTNGLPDIRDLGVKIRRMNVAKVKAIGELAKDAEQAARERQQRARQREQLATRDEGIKYVRDNMNVPEHMTDDQIWDYLLVEEAIVPRTIKDVRISSSKNSRLTEAAAAVGAAGGDST